MVHWVNTGEINNAEEQDASSISDATVTFTALIDLLLGYFAVLHSLIYLGRKVFRVLKLVNESFIEEELSDASGSL